MKNLVREKDFYKTFFRLTLAVAFQNVIVYCVNLADNVMLGAYTENALAGAALANQVQFLLQMMVMGVGEGLLVLSSRFWGEKNVPQIKKTASIGLLAAAFVTALLFFAVYFFPETVIGLLTDDPEALAEGVKYIKVVCFSYPFFLITNVIVIMLRSVETVRIGVVMNAIALVTNVSLNYLLIFGKAGLPEMGSEGAALATVISRAVETLVVVIYLFGFDKKLKMKPGDFFQKLPAQGDTGHDPAIPQTVGRDPLFHTDRDNIGRFQKKCSVCRMHFRHPRVFTVVVSQQVIEDMAEFADINRLKHIE